MEMEKIRSKVICQFSSNAFSMSLTVWLRRALWRSLENDDDDFDATASMMMMMILKLTLPFSLSTHLLFEKVTFCVNTPLGH